MIVVDTGAMLALIDRSDRHHRTLAALYRDNPAAWVLPWAILPEVDYLVGSQLGPRARQAWLADLVGGAFPLEWGTDADVERAAELNRAYSALRLGLVDGVVIAVAERLGAEAIATLDLRHFGAIAIKGRPRLVPRDL